MYVCFVAMMMELALSVIVDEKMFLTLYSMLSYKVDSSAFHLYKYESMRFSIILIWYCLHR